MTDAPRSAVAGPAAFVSVVSVVLVGVAVALVVAAGPSAGPGTAMIGLPLLGSAFTAAAGAFLVSRLACRISGSR